MRTRKPTLRITKRVRRVQTAGPRIPFEAECTACADAQFKIKCDKRAEHGCHDNRYPPPDYERFMNALKAQFEKHLELKHTDD